jgi:hypothetical protein
VGLRPLGRLTFVVLMSLGPKFGLNL